MQPTVRISNNIWRRNPSQWHQWRLRKATCWTAAGDLNKKKFISKFVRCLSKSPYPSYSLLTKSPSLIRGAKKHKGYLFLQRNCEACLPHDSFLNRSWRAPDSSWRSDKWLVTCCTKRSKSKLLTGWHSGRNVPPFGFNRHNYTNTHMLTSLW